MVIAAAVWAATSASPAAGVPAWLTYFGLAIGAAGSAFVALNWGARQRDQATIQSQNQYIASLERLNKELQQREAAMVPSFARDIADALAEFVPKIIDAVDNRDDRREARRRQERGGGT